VNGERLSTAYNIQHYEAGYTLAESFFTGTPYLGWEGVVVGDPLAAPYLGAATPVTPAPALPAPGRVGIFRFGWGVRLGRRSGIVR
jgi:hypothetical protein